MKNPGRNAVRNVAVKILREVRTRRPWTELV